MTSTVGARHSADARRGSPASRRGDRAALLAPALLTAIGLGAAVVVFLWWNNTASVVSTAAWITNAGRLCGLLAGYAAPVLVVLMARIPLIDRTLGSDRLARWHAMGGRYMVGLVLSHVLLIIWGYALTDHNGLVHQTAQLVFHYPDMLKATIGTLLLLGVGAVSARAARRRLSYETWYYLHLATYVAIFLTFFHQLANGAEFVLEAKARIAWYGLYVGSAALILWFRFAVPTMLAFRHRLRVAEVRPEGPGVHSVFITGRFLNELAGATRSGQFFRWRFLQRGLLLAGNPYSLSAPPNADYLRITVKDLGGHSAALARLRPGTRVFAEGPYGAFTADRRPGRRGKVLLLAAGVGITPLRALFESIPARNGELTLVYRASSEDDLIFRAELESIAEARGARLYYLVGSRSRIGEPLQARSLLGILPDLREHTVFLCGPDGMTRTAHEALETAGVPRNRIHHESFEF
ncbi:ferredoxin reductase family protein [Streptacidiphilus carbonis]|jgi:ferredoxin-NADP reductase|uniref:ferredoxin reductase family protein n=1 Tax=Streptacidiphilus carbonis TaxID=105422 RepID=UPI0005A863C4|nr:ferredoxin reductase family protein [Streptacidiphilus carbonis]